MNDIDDSDFERAVDWFNSIKNKEGPENVFYEDNTNRYFIVDNAWNYDRDDQPGRFGPIYFDTYDDYKEEWGEIIYKYTNK